jgi:hypothetical protein
MKVTKAILSGAALFVLSAPAIVRAIGNDERNAANYSAA